MLALFLGWYLTAMNVFVSQGRIEYHLGARGDYDKAEQFCFSLGMTMVKVSTVGELTRFGDFLLDQSRSGDVWIGLRHNGFIDPTDFSWPDDTKLTWSSWGDVDAIYKEEPNYLKIHHCVIMSHLKWYTRDCSNSNYIACQLYSLGPYFTRLDGFLVKDSPVLEVKSLSGTQCAAYCVRLNLCELIQVHTNGDCSLFYWSDAALIASTDTDHIRAYRRL